ncbi:MAG: zinc metalloprotease HtpX [Candidatus Thiodiazotropha taylori]|nr:zinc metalloprotease HtpX [Candidatus Thiodiazotropha taylori]
MTATSPIDADTWLQHAWRNRLQSLLLLGVLAGFLALLGWLLWGRDGLFVLVTVGVVAVLANPAFSPWLIMRMYGARPLDHAEAPVLWRAMSELTARAGLATPPELFYVPSRMLNAFAVGTREQSAIAVTDGLLRQLELDELIGVLAHEVSHIRSNDLWVMGLADLFSRATSLLSLLGQFLLLLNLPLILFSQVTISWWAILLLIFAPNLSALAQLALSRTREYDADLNAARLTGNPNALARALARIERVQGGWLEQIFLPGRRVPEPSLLRTHPHTEERIARLMALKPALKGIDPSWARREPVPDINALLGARVRRVPRWHMNGLWY